MQHPGEVWLLPPDAREGGDPKARAHVLLTPCTDGTETATFAFASTRGTEAAFGAANVRLDPSATSYGRSGRTGFQHPTCVFPSRLVPAARSDLIRFKGRIIDEMTAIWRSLHVALGITTGTADAGGVAAGSWRGRIVRFSDAYARELECSFGVVVTEPGYSKAQRYQTIVPVLDPGEYEPDERDVVVPDQAWVRVIDPDLRGLWLAADMVQSVFHPTEIDTWTGVTVDEATMAEIETSLLHLFGLS
jgi:hypothetical protein